MSSRQGDIVLVIQFHVHLARQIWSRSEAFGAALFHLGSRWMLGLGPVSQISAIDSRWRRGKPAFQAKRQPQFLKPPAGGIMLSHHGSCLRSLIVSGAQIQWRYQSWDAGREPGAIHNTDCQTMNRGNVTSLGVQEWN